MNKKKICLVGGLGVGKTSLAKRFLNENFDDKWRASVGVNIYSKLVCIDGNRVKLLLGDVEGKQDSRRLPMVYLGGASAIIYVVDGTRLETLETVMDIRQDIELELGGSLPGLVLFNKSDLADQWEVSNEMISQVETDGMLTLLTSCKEGSGVDTAFDLIGRVVMGKTTLVAA